MEPPGYSARWMGAMRACTLLFALLGVRAGRASHADLYDFDGDGDPDVSDCGPSDPESHFGAPDPFGDGIDQNCDGRDGEDRDGDGYPADS